MIRIIERELRYRSCDTATESGAFARNLFDSEIAGSKLPTMMQSTFDNNQRILDRLGLPTNNPLLCCFVILDRLLALSYTIATYYEWQIHDFIDAFRMLLVVFTTYNEFGALYRAVIQFDRAESACNSIYTAFTHSISKRSLIVASLSFNDLNPASLAGRGITIYGDGGFKCQLTPADYVGTLDPSMSQQPNAKVFCRGCMGTQVVLPSTVFRNRKITYRWVGRPSKNSEQEHRRCCECDEPLQDGTRRCIFVSMDDQTDGWVGKKTQTADADDDTTTKA